MPQALALVGTAGSALTAVGAGSAGAAMTSLAGSSILKGLAAMGDGGQSAPSPAQASINQNRAQAPSTPTQQTQADVEKLVREILAKESAQ